MPIYEYICLDCKKEYEMLRSFNEADRPMECEQCGGENVKRKLSVFYAQSGGSTVSGPIFNGRTLSPVWEQFAAVSIALIPTSCCTSMFAPRGKSSRPMGSDKNDII